MFVVSQLLIFIYIYIYLDALRKLPKVMDGNENSVESGNSSPMGTPSSTRKDSKLVKIDLKSI
jgi:hypothetical protein